VGTSPAKQVSATDPASTLPARPEVDTVLSSVEQRRAMLIGVEGRPGTGRTTFLSQVRARAEALNWSTLTCGELQASTTPASFISRLRVLLPNKPAETLNYEDALADLLKILTQYSPIVLTIDGFWASQEFAQWFCGEFLIHVKATGSAVVVVCADRPAHAACLAGHTDLSVSLDSVDKNWLLEVIGRAAADCAPPFTNEELDGYAGELSSRPEFLGDFLRVLVLVRNIPEGTLRDARQDRV
jgi:hypothetical protein